MKTFHIHTLAMAWLGSLVIVHRSASPDTFPAICHSLLRHPDDAVAALTENTLAGGDNAARGIIIGMIHGAKPNASPLPEHWLTHLRAFGEIQQLLTTIHSHT